MGVKLIVDSASDIRFDRANELGIGFAPLKTILAGKEYRDGIDIVPDEFYGKLEAQRELASTSQVTPAEFSDLFAAAVAKGDEVVVLTISSGLSGTAQSAHIAAAEFAGKVFVVDSLSATSGEQLLLAQALRMKEAGCTAAEIAAELEDLKKKIKLFVLVDTLEYLKRGGRVSKTAAFVGGMLHFMPLLTLNAEGKLESVGKARGRKMSHKFLNDNIEKCGKIDFTYPLVISYAGDPNDGTVASYLADSSALYAGNEDKITVGQLGCVIGTHVGPGGIVLAYVNKA